MLQRPLLFGYFLLASVLVTYAQSDVFVRKTDGYNNYRIPSIILTKNSVLLAFAEGRSSLLDHAENDIVLKRSFDEGRTWQPLQTIAEDGENALNNPQVLIRSDGRVLLMYQRYAKGFGERRAMPGLDGEHICRTFVQLSDNDGENWSAPVDVTAQVKRPEATSMATGPGIGLELRHGKYAGRLIMPANQGPVNNWFVYAIYSDDGGKTWQKGELAPYPKRVRGWANEVQMVELTDGRLLLNARSVSGNHKRKIAYSEDGGRTWSEVMDEKQLIEPECQASFIQYAGDTLLFCNPRHRSRRLRGTVYASIDGGTTWPFRKTIYKGGFAYSGLVRLSNGRVGILYEKDGYRSIRFETLHIKDILDPDQK